MSEQVPGTVSGRVVALGDPKAVLDHRSARTGAIERHRLASRDAMTRYRSELAGWLVELLTELFGAGIDRLVFDQRPGPFGGFEVRLLAGWDRAGVLLWRDPLSEDLERELEQSFGQAVLTGMDGESRHAVETLIDRIQSADSWPWFPDLGLHQNEEGFPLPAPTWFRLGEVCEVKVADCRDHLVRVRAESGRIVEEYVVIHAVSTEERFRELERAIGVPRFSLGRFKGGHGGITLSAPEHDVDAAVRWARRQGLVHEVTRTRCCEPFAAD